MAAFDLEEQEQLETLKAWWKRWGNAVMLGVALLFAATAGWRYWQYRTATQAEEAAAIYDRLTQAMEAKDTKLARDAGAMLIDKYAATPFAPRAALLLGKINHASRDDKSAVAQLEWAIAHTKEVAVKDLARLRLASVHLDGKRYDAAMAQLRSPHSEAFGARFDDLTGDVAMAEGKRAEARASYQAAWAKLEADNPYRSIVELKLDALGGPSK